MTMTSFTIFSSIFLKTSIENPVGESPLLSCIAIFALVAVTIVYCINGIAEQNNELELVRHQIEIDANGFFNFILIENCWSFQVLVL